jgi:hypothetical protein
MPIIRKQDGQQEESPYALLRLTNNPFLPDPIIRPRSKDPRANGAIFADGCRREVISRFEKLLINDFDNRSRLSLLWSDGDKESGRGTGKTALLRHFQHRINHDWGQSELRGLSAAVMYVAFPDQVDRLYSEQLAWAALVDAHESGLIRAAAASLRIAVIEKRWPDAAKKIIAEVEQHEKEGKDWYGLLFGNDDLSRFGVDGDELGRVVIEDLVDAEIDEGFADALSSDGVLDYLRGLRRDGQVRPYWVSRDTKGLGAAKHLLFDQFVRFLDKTGFSGAYLFIDDIENLTDQMSNKESIEFAKELGLAFLRPGRAAGDLRYFTAVLTTHQQAATKLARGWSEAGLQAVARLDPTAETSIRVPLPNEDGALEMMAAYIERHRSDGPAVDRLHPFTDAAARKLVSGVQPPLHPRTFLQKAHFVVKQAADEKTERIDVQDVERMFEVTGAKSTLPTATAAIEEFPDY